MPGSFSDYLSAYLVVKEILYAVPVVGRKSE